MRERTWTFDHTDDRYQLPPEGPWVGEPDKVQWVDEETNLDCLLLRNHWGVWCGYVGVPKKHPWYAVPYGDICHICSKGEEYGPDVHGGLTFSGFCAPGEPLRGICHLPQFGVQTKPWWIGFDCGHAFDVTPALIEVTQRFDPDGKSIYDKLAEIDSPEWMRETYRTVGYAKAEVVKLAKQVHDARR